MSLGTANRDGGKTSESGHLRPIQRGYLGEVLAGLNVSQRGAGANMSVDIAIGDAIIPRSDRTYGHPAFNDAVLNQVITTADPSNPRRDILVMYIDYGQTPSTAVSNNTNGVVKVKVVAGTPAGSPSDPTTASIQSSVGSGNPFIQLARIRVGAGVTSVANSVIDDLRRMATGTLQGGWIYDSTYAWVYASATTFTISGVDASAQFAIGTKVWLYQGSVAKYFYVASVVFSTNTTVTLDGGGVYSLTSAPIDKPAYSYNDRPITFPYQVISNPKEWWQELGRTKLATAGSSVSVSFTAKKYLKILTSGNANGGTLQVGLQFNGDTSTIYNFGYLTGSAATGTVATSASIAISGQTISGGNWNLDGEITNIIGLNKQAKFDASFDITSIANGYAPGYQKTVAKWINTSVQINRIDLIIFSGTGNFAIGSELVVLGHD